MMTQKYDYIVVGAGLCGLTLTKELQDKNKKILILEKGNFIKNLGSFMDAFLFYDKHSLLWSRQGVLIYRVIGVGGTSIASCGNAVELSSEQYKKIGIDFKKELDEAKKECFVRCDLPLGKIATKMMVVANRLGYAMRPMPKFNINGNCLQCGNCVFGCKHNAKWTAVEQLRSFDTHKNIHMVTGITGERILTNHGNAVGIEAIKHKFKKVTYFADKIILTAGGIGTPIILQNSGISEAGSNLFVDLFNVVYGESSVKQNQRNEMPMSIVYDKFREKEGFILSPILDNFIGFLSTSEFRNMTKVFRLDKIIGIMVKIADDEVGKVWCNGLIDKAPTKGDIIKLEKGDKIARDILVQCGISPKKIFVSKLRGAHPGGTAKIGTVVNNRLETRINNLFVCDASVLPFAPGVPPMLSLIALSKWFGKHII
jgi:choline dehydrogenase-like flavoprotein